MKECGAEQLEFHARGKRDMLGQFDGGLISSDGGGLLLADCFDARLSGSPQEVEEVVAAAERVSPRDGSR